MPRFTEGWRGVHERQTARGEVEEVGQAIARWRMTSKKFSIFFAPAPSCTLLAEEMGTLFSFLILIKDQGQVCLNKSRVAFQPCMVKTTHRTIGSHELVGQIRETRGIDV
jgi:hypothetical protein